MMRCSPLSFAPVCLAVVGLASVTSGYLVLYTANWARAYGVANQVGPVVVLVASGAASYGLFKRSTVAVWSPMPWFLAVCAVYYGFGPLAYYYSTDESVAFMDAFYPIDERALFSTNLLSVVGIGTVCVGFFIGELVMSRIGYAQAVSACETQFVKRMMWSFVILGGISKYCFVMPYRMGLLEGALPAAGHLLSDLLTAAIVLLFVLVKRGERRYGWLLGMVIITELASDLVVLSKLDVLFTAITVTLGWYLCRPNVRLLCGSGLVLILLYGLVLSPILGLAKFAFDPKGPKDPLQFLALLQAYNSSDVAEVLGSASEVQGWWTRLSYGSAQAFVMNAYDSGLGGTTLELIPYTFVPRAIYQNKPVMTSGEDFTWLVMGEDSSSTSAGIFGEAYWNGGWPLVLVVCLFVGLVLALMGRASMRIIESEQYVYVPIAIMGVFVGLRPDDWFVPTYVAMLVQVAALYLLLRFLLVPCCRLRLPRVGMAPA